MRGGKRESFCEQPAVVPDDPMCCQRQIIFNQVNEAALEATADVDDGNVMSTGANALAHAGAGLRRTGQPEVVQFDLIAKSPCAAKEPDISLAAQRGFQRERVPAPDVVVNFLQEQPRSFDGAGARIERRKSVRRRSGSGGI